MCKTCTKSTASLAYATGPDPPLRRSRQASCRSYGQPYPRTWQNYPWKYYCAENHMAKQRQEFVRARLGQLKKRMGELSLINMNNIPHDRAGLGSTVEVFDQTKEEEIVYFLVTSEESDVTQGRISTTSPIGRGLMGKK